MMQVIEAQPDMPILGVITLYSSLLTFTLHVHPDRLDYADQVLVSYCLKLYNAYSHKVYDFIAHKPRYIHMPNQFFFSLFPNIKFLSVCHLKFVWW